jgi:septal ring factor EnvC (AmiA/AmiB activator)
VIRDKNGEPLSVRYDQINAMLLNEFLKAHKKIEQQQGSITELKATVAQQQSKFQATTAEQQKQIRNLIAQLKEQAIQIQKVSAQIEMSKPAPNIAASRP